MSLPDSTAERAREGAKVRRQVLGAAYVDAGKQQANPFTQHFIEFTQTQCWGYAWLRDGLTHKTRSQLNVCMLAALALTRISASGAVLRRATIAVSSLVVLAGGTGSVSLRAK